MFAANLMNTVAKLLGFVPQPNLRVGRLRQNVALVLNRFPDKNVGNQNLDPLTPLTLEPSYYPEKKFVLITLTPVQG